MLKRLGFIGRWILGIALVVGAIVVVTRQDQHARSKHKRECQEHMAAIPSLIRDKEYGDDYCKEPSNYMQWWDVLIAWPEGITVWVILVTLAVIAEQTRQTRRSADISERVLVSQFRPRVRVRGVNLRIPGDGEQPRVPSCGFDLIVVNAGGTSATVQSFEVTAEWISGSAPSIPIFKKQIPDFSLAVGEIKTFPLEIGEATPFLVRCHSISGELEGGRKQVTFPVCRGTIVYFDLNGAERRTGFARAFDFLQARTIPSSDPELEYED